MDTRKTMTESDRIAKVPHRKSGANAAKLAKALFLRARKEDLQHLSSYDRAAMAESLWDNLQSRQAGAAKINIRDLELEKDGPSTSAVTIVEVINDDMPFLVDSVLGEVQNAGHTIELVLHPLLLVDRDKDGSLKNFHGLASQGGGGERESVLHIHIKQASAEAKKALQNALQDVLQSVKVAVADWRPMLARVDDAISNFQDNPPPLPLHLVAEAIKFLEWLKDDNFTFLGMRVYRYSAPKGHNKTPFMAPDTKSGLGILANPKAQVLRRAGQDLELTPEIQAFLDRPEPFIVTKANAVSKVHRRVHMDYIGIKLFSENGLLEGELRIVGLFTSTAYTRTAHSIPYLRHKLNAVLKRSGYDAGSHSGKALIDVLETYPRDELFQIGEDTLYKNAISIMHLHEKPSIRAILRQDKFDRFVSIMVFIPRDRYNSERRAALGDYLAIKFAGRVSAFFPAFPGEALARVHFIIGRDAGKTPAVDSKTLERDISDLFTNWSDGFEKAIRQQKSNAAADRLIDRYRDAFSSAYQSHYDFETAVDDAEIIEGLSADASLHVAFSKQKGEKQHRITLRLFHITNPMSLSARVPILENMGFAVINERTLTIAPSGRDGIYLHEMTLEAQQDTRIDLQKSGQRLQDAFHAVWRRDVDNDTFNALILSAQLDWREVNVLRAFSRYLHQAKLPYGQDFVANTLRNHAKITSDLVAYFTARFDPALKKTDRDDQMTRIARRLTRALDGVASLDDDRIIQRLMNIMGATLRTNFYQFDKKEGYRPALAFKFDPSEIDGLVEPRPYREIFVYSPRVEGVHLRFGPIARGGLRWSDRLHDYRTEILGLVKAQQVKNAVIVPVGAKGGFVPKYLGEMTDRDSFGREGQDAYKIFIGSLLDITDNLAGDRVAPPRRVVRHDRDDPYLVVAADKGTATFSDTANGISAEREFWLDDAFASGGSAGYDHKKMGITARGAWESVKRHFREMDTDIQKTPFSVVGVGDMSGDVFGNGMLLSPAIRLVAAFDHRDIFIDPDPDIKKSFTERKRIFEMGRSSWQDYDEKLISKGGGIFSRSLKAIPLSKEIQQLLGLKKAKATPQDVMTAIIKAEADLLWFGGIGTYIRATNESDLDVGDKANDAIRITAPELRCKVIGEGANLGLTQKARIEFGAHGGRCNSDAIDNSAGVNSSDLEVNIKIALGAAINAGKLKLPTRNRFLAQMTDDVAELCLRNNYLQGLAVSLSERSGCEELPHQRRLMDQLESRGLLDRVVELLPDDSQMVAREVDKNPLTRAETGVLLAYSKLTLFQDLLDGSVPDDPYFASVLSDYFPEAMRNRYGKQITGHRLWREIVATVLSNKVINRGGPTFLQRIEDRTGTSTDQVVVAFAAVDACFGLEDLYHSVDLLDTKIPGDVQLGLYARIQSFMTDCVIWFLRNVSLSDGIQQVAKRFGEGHEAIVKALEVHAPKSMKEASGQCASAWSSSGVPKALAHQLAHLDLRKAVPSIQLIAEQTGRSGEDVAHVYQSLSETFQLTGVEQSLSSLQASDYYDSLALDGALDMMGRAHRDITRSVLALDTKPAKALVLWSRNDPQTLDKTVQTIDDICKDDQLTVGKMSVIASLLSHMSSTG